MKDSKHIAIFVPSFLGGGVERMMVYLANYLVSRGYNIDYIVIKNYGPYKELLSDKVNLINLDKKRVLFSFFDLSIYLRKNKPDVLLSVMNYVNLIIFFANTISFTNTKHIISERDIPTNNINKSKFKYLFKIVVKKIYPKVDKIIAISKDVKIDLIKNFKIKPEKITVINNMVNLDLFDINHKVDKSLIYENIFDDNFKNQKIIIAIGRLVKYKNFSYLINSFSIAEKKNNNIRLLILGEGNERKDLEKQIETLNLTNKIALPGFLNESHKYLKCSDLFISTSIYEGFGNVIIEAMAAGLPVIVTDCIGGPKEIVQNGKFGDVVPLNKPQVLANKILERIESDFDKSISLNRAKDFSVDKISENYLNVLLNEC